MAETMKVKGLTPPFSRSEDDGFDFAITDSKGILVTFCYSANHSDLIVTALNRLPQASPKERLE